jgi:hypothetical protein
MTTNEVNQLGESEMRTGLGLAMVLGFVSVFALIGGSIGAAVVMPSVVIGVVFVTVFLGAAAATGVMFWAWKRRNEIVSKFVNHHLPEKQPAPPTLIDVPPAPALPPALETGTEASRGGEGARKIHGFDPATIMWLCDYLAAGNLWTEGALEKMPVPHMQPPTPFGKSEVGKPYYRLFDAKVPAGLFVRAGIIIERGGPGNPPGKLAIKSPLGMLERIKNLPEDAQGGE